MTRVLALTWAACGRPPAVEVREAAGGVEVAADAPIRQVELARADGSPVAARMLPSPSVQAWLGAPIEPGVAYEVRVRTSRGSASATWVAPIPAGPVDVEVEAPRGQGVGPVVEGDVVQPSVAAGEAVQIAVLVTARDPGPVSVAFGDDRRERVLEAAGERWVEGASVSGPTAVRVEARDWSLHFAIDPVAIPPDAVRDRVRIVDARFPADATGRPDPARVPGRISLPSRGWEIALRAAGFGFRAADHQAPWAWEGVTLENSGPDPLDVVLRSVVVDGEGNPVRAFRPRIREADGGTGAVTVLVRVPARGRVTAALPLFVDRVLLDGGSWTRELDVVPLGATRPLLSDRRSLVAMRGSGWAGALFAAGLGASVAGFGLVALRLRRWLANSATSELTTIALFGTLGFAVTVASTLIGMAVGAVLGPFSPLLTGLFDDAVRAALMATLLTLNPRTGVAALTLLVGAVLRTMTLGRLAPTDVLFLGAEVAWIEGALWVAGLTRSGAWRDGPAFGRWLRLAAGLGASSAVASATSLGASVVLYRLHYADWYVATIVGLPGFLYVVIATAIAVPFAASLRSVQS